MAKGINETSKDAEGAEARQVFGGIRQGVWR